MLPKQDFCISAHFGRMNTPQKRPSINPNNKANVDDMLLTPHGSRFQSGFFQDAQQHFFRFIQLARVLSSSAPLCHPNRKQLNSTQPTQPTPNNPQPTQPTQPTQLQATQKKPNSKQLSQPNSKQPNSNYQLPGTESQRRCCRRNPWVRHLGDPQISELNRFTDWAKPSYSLYLAGNTQHFLGGKPWFPFWNHLNCQTSIQQLP